MSNIGSLENKGVEFTIGGKVVQTSDWMWDVNYNITYNKNEITKLTTGDSEGYYIPVGGISVGTGNTAQAPCRLAPLETCSQPWWLWGT